MEGITIYEVNYTTVSITFIAVIEMPVRPQPMNKQIKQ